MTIGAWTEKVIAGAQEAPESSLKQSMPSPPSHSTHHAPRHVVITGASGGIGRAVALRYAAPGVTLSLAGRDPARTASVAAACQERGARVASALLDVVDAAALAAWLETRDDALAIDTIIAAAGLGGRDAMAGPAGESLEQATRLFGTNMMGVVNTLAPLLPRMVARRQGRIAVIGSMAGWLGMPQGPAYSGSKAAAALYADGLRRLLTSSGVRVTTVLPGFVDTAMSQSLGGPQPWRWTPERAAERIVAAIEAGERRCIFPWQMRAAFWLVSLLPTPLLDRVLVQSHLRLSGRSGD